MGLFFLTNIDIPLQTPYTFGSHLWKRCLKVGYLSATQALAITPLSPQAMRRNELQNNPLLISHNSSNATYDTTIKLTPTKSMSGKDHGPLRSSSFYKTVTSVFPQKALLSQIPSFTPPFLFFFFFFVFFLHFFQFLFLLFNPFLFIGFCLC
jgi:hypothetical protein